MVSSLKRLLLYVAIMQFRGWVLYAFLDKVENFLVKIFTWKNLLGIDLSGNSTTCWYSSHLLRNDSCNTGKEFDFSDHVVFFFAHSLSIMVFEALFWFSFPCCDDNGSENGKTVAKNNGKDQSLTLNPYPRKRFTSYGNILAFCVNVILPVPLMLAFCYVNIIVMMSIRSTAAYFHTFGEVVVGYGISLVVQVPFGLILCSEEWATVRSFLGFPVRRKKE